MNNVKKTVTVILCTHKYVEYAEQQIKSIKNQINVNIKIIISIDSKEKNIILDWKLLVKKYFNDCDFQIVYGPMKGFSENFLSTLVNLDETTNYYSFSDHDDIWDEDKLYCAIEKIKHYDNSKPLLYGSRSRYIDNKNRYISLSNDISYKTSFSNSLVQCYAGGNTMLFNNSLLEIVKKIGFVQVKSHDWWLYILSTSTGGLAIFDSDPHISYRQHDSNISGSNKGLKQIIIRIFYIFKGDFREWNMSNVSYLSENLDLISEKNKNILNSFIKIQNGNFFERVLHYYKSGIYRQSFFQNIGLFVFILIKKI